MADREKNEKETDEKKLEQETAVEYEVGYGKPPKHGRFQKGISGNPNGRPKVARDIGTAVLRELNTRITINENGRQIRVSKLDVMAKQAVNIAMKGNAFHWRQVLEVSQQAAEKEALLAAQKAKDADLKKHRNYKLMSTQELEGMLAEQLAAAERAKKSVKP